MAVGKLSPGDYQLVKQGILPFSEEIERIKRAGYSSFFKAKPIGFLG